jgi:hypothetical protein
MKEHSYSKKHNIVTDFILLIYIFFLLANSLFLNIESASNNFYKGPLSREYPLLPYSVEVEIFCPQQANFSGPTEQYKVRIRNTGILRETIRLIVTIEYKEVLVFKVEEEYEDIPRGGVTEWEGLIVIPTYIQDGESLKLIATAIVNEDPNEKDTDEGIVLIRAPCLLITDISFSKNTPMDGENITITATIFNKGHNKAFFFTVKFFDKDQMIGEYEIDILPIGERKDVNINWVSTKGTHEIKGTVPRNGNDDSYYINGTLSELSKKIIVENSKTVVTIFAIISIIVAISIGIYLFKRKYH